MDADAESVENRAVDEKFLKLEVFARCTCALFGAIIPSIIGTAIASSHWGLQLLSFSVGIIIYFCLMIFHNNFF